jgi:hypothetical protein
MSTTMNVGMCCLLRPHGPFDSIRFYSICLLDFRSVPSPVSFHRLAQRYCRTELLLGIFVAWRDSTVMKGNNTTNEVTKCVDPPEDDETRTFASERVMIKSE